MDPGRIPGVRRLGRWLALLRVAASGGASPLEVARRIALYRRVLPYTGVELPRLATLLRLADRVEEEGIEGAIVECGTCNGGSAGVLVKRTARSARPVWLFDSFEGLPEPTEADGEEARAYAGLYSGSVERVRELLRRLGEEGPRVRIVKGWFAETLPSAEVGSVALLHVDADWHDSVRDVLERFYDDVTPGGFVVLDDYGRWPGCRRATDEFLARRGIGVPLVPVDYTGVWFRKPGSGGSGRRESR